MTKLRQLPGWGSRVRLRAAKNALVLVVMVVEVVFAAQWAEAQRNFTRLYSFEALPDGEIAVAGLIQDAAGNLFGTTRGGGKVEYGTVFKLDTAGTETVLHSFMGGNGGDGIGPAAGLVWDPTGNLYGTTVAGGKIGYGTVFKVDATTGAETLLYSFAGTPDGEGPFSGLIRDAAGNLYGTTQAGGAHGRGTVFKVDATGTETVLHSFGGPSDGISPFGTLIQDAAGNLYGTTLQGGPNGYGTVFKVDATGTETVLYGFAGRADGGLPYAGLVQDAAGNFYGTTERGGASDKGTVFKLDTTGVESVLYNFTGGADGSVPYAGLVRDAAGNLYGTTLHGGASDLGTVFRVDTTGMETVLHSFKEADGVLPYAGLLRDAAGNLYGTTYKGGVFHEGTVFEISR